MDELTLIREFADDTPLPDAARLAAVREQLMTGIAPQRRRRRLRLVGVTSIGIAAATAAPLVVTMLPTVPADQPPQPQITNVAVVLHNAADAARNDHTVAPKPGQYLYRKMVSPERTTEEWLSVDGKQDGYRTVTPPSPGFPARERIPGCVDGKSRGVNSAGHKVVEPCRPQPGYLDGHITTTDQAITFVAGTYSYPSQREDFMKGAFVMLLSHDLSPRLRGDLFDALTTVQDMPGQKITVQPHTRDLTGREGIGLTWTYDDPGQDPTVMRLILDPKTYQCRSGLGGAIVVNKVVDKIGQR